MMNFRTDGSQAAVWLLFTALAAAMVTGCAATVPGRMKTSPDETEEKQASKLFLEGKMEEAKENWAGAITNYIEAFQYDPDSDEIASAIATLFVREKKNRSAIQYIKIALRIKPNEPKYWRVLQLLEQQEGRFDEATAALKMYMKLNPDYKFQDVIRLSQYYFAMEKPGNAKKLLLGWATLKTTTAQEMYEIAEMLAFNGFSEEAISVYTTLNERDPLDIKGWLFLGDHYEREGRDEEALDTYYQALENNPGSIPVLVTIGNHCLVKNDWACCLSYFEKVYNAGREKIGEAGIDFNDVISTLCSVYFYNGKDANGLALLDTLKTSGSDDASVYFSLGKAMNYLDRYEEARDYYRTGFQKDISEVGEGPLFRVYIGYSHALVKLGNEDEAVRIIRNEAKNYIKDTNSLKELEASIYIELKRYDDAIALYEWLLASDPGNRGYLIGSSMVYDLAGQFDRAEQALLKILESEPEDPLALNNLAYMYLENDVNISRAYKMVQKALINDPQNGAYLDTLGWAYYKMGSYKKARTEIENALKWADKADKGIIYEHYGDVLVKTDEWEKAREAYRNAIEFGEDEAKILPKLEKLNQ